MESTRAKRKTALHSRELIRQIATDCVESESDEHELSKEEESESDCDEFENIREYMHKKKKCVNFKKRKANSGSKYSDQTELEKSASQVLERFKRGCECQEETCFEDLDPETVYKHRLNIAELTKAERDMYLMGLIRSCLTNPYETMKRTERQRLRTYYIYQGRRVCLEAFLNLENCTHYQVKRLRKHMIAHGIVPRVHGNHGKVPHNTFALDIYRFAAKFLKNFVKKQEVIHNTKATRDSPLRLPAELTRKVLYDSYKEYCDKVAPNDKILGFSSFRNFLKVQFPQLKFARMELVVREHDAQNQNNAAKTDAPSNATLPDLPPSGMIINPPGKFVLVRLDNNSLRNNQPFVLTPPISL